MPRFGMIDCSLWDRPEFARLSKEAMLVLIFMWTNQKRNSAGIYRESRESMSIICPLSRLDFINGFNEILHARFIHYDEERSVIAIHNFVKWCTPQNPNVVRGWKPVIASVPRNSPVAMLWFSQTKEFLSKEKPELARVFEESFWEMAGKDVAAQLTLAGSAKQAVPSSNKKKSVSSMTDEEFIDSLKKNPAYSHIDIDIQLAKMDAWMDTHPGRQKTRRFIVGWLNRIERPIGVAQRSGVLTSVGQKNAAIALRLLEKKGGKESAG